VQRAFYAYLNKAEEIIKNRKQTGQDKAQLPRTANTVHAVFYPAGHLADWSEVNRLGSRGVQDRIVGCSGGSNNKISTLMNVNSGFTV
jgi:hypothetical protein